MLKIFKGLKKMVESGGGKIPKSGKKRQAENGKVSQAVNADGNHQTFFFFVGDGKHDATHNLGEGKVTSVGQYKEYGADQDGRINTPAPEKSEDNTSEK